MGGEIILNQFKFDKIISEVKKKKNLQGLSNSLIHSEVDQFLKKNPSISTQLLTKNDKDFSRSSLLKKAVKEVRSSLHKSYGVFNPDQKKKQLKLLEKLSKLKNKREKEIHRELLKTNISTKERIDLYEQIYEEIFKITSKPLSILDLSSGLNPMSFPWMALETVLYTATEINEQDKILLNNYFRIMSEDGLDGKAVTLDLLNEDSLGELKQISEVDVVFMFKLLESINFPKKTKYKHMENILSSTNGKWVVVSFPTKTISGRSMKFERRQWFDMMLKRLKKDFDKIEKSNEIFYVIKNN